MSVRTHIKTGSKDRRQVCLPVRTLHDQQLLIEGEYSLVCANGTAARRRLESKGQRAHVQTRRGSVHPGRISRRAPSVREHRLFRAEWVWPRGDCAAARPDLRSNAPAATRHQIRCPHRSVEANNQDPPPDTSDSHTLRATVCVYRRSQRGCGPRTINSPTICHHRRPRRSRT